MGRHALLVAAGEYGDPTLNRLRAPAQDVERLAALLEDPGIGGFDSVTVLNDKPDQVVRRALEDAVAARLAGDLLFVYFSCHGFVDRSGRLYFACTDTEVGRPASTAVSSSFLNELMESSLAAAKVLVLDCCYSGAFAEGFKAAPGAALDGRVGKGYVVLSACDRYEFALEGVDIVESDPRNSLFTDVLVEGIASGNADLDGDGTIEVFELFRYVYDGVVARAPQQTPRSWSANAGPDIHVASVPRRPLDQAPAKVTADDRPATNNYRRNQAVVARGMRSATDLIRQTMGPLGRRALFVDEGGHHVELADSRAVAARLRPDDPRDRLGASYVVELVQRVHGTVGGHAATAAVLAQEMVDGAAAVLRTGATPVGLSREIRAAVDTAVQRLLAAARPVDSLEDLQQALLPAARGDATVSELVAAAMDKVGFEGVITVEESNTLGFELELTEGLSVEAGYVSPHFVTDPGHEEAVLHDSHVLVLAKRLATIDSLVPLLEKVMQTGKPLVVVAGEVGGQALTTLVVNKVKGTFLSAAVQVGQQADVLTDVAVVTGARVIQDESQLADLEVGSLGQARRVVITVDRTEIVEGAGRAEEIHRHVDRLREEISRAVPTNQAALRLRLARIAGGVAVLKVGAVGEAALQLRKAQVEDVVRIGRRIVADGLVPGGGIGLTQVADELTRDGGGSRGALIVAGALREPMAQLLANAELPLTPLTSQGFDAVTGRTGPMVDLGILDSAGALGVALEQAADVVHRFLMTA